MFLAATKFRHDWTPWAFAVVCAPLVLLGVELFRGALTEWEAVGNQIMTSEIRQLQSGAQRRAAMLEVLLQAHLAGEAPWTAVRGEPWFQSHWSAAQPQRSPVLYCAIVDDAGRVIIHTDPAKIGQRLEHSWYERRVAAAPQVVWSKESLLAGNRPSFDASLPLHAGGLRLGDYHEGLDSAWLDAQIAGQRRGVAGRWFWVIVVMLSIDGAAVIALVSLARRQRELARAVQSGAARRTRELAQVGSGLAHEIRNPLHALRINLHTLRRALARRSPLSEEQLLETIKESDGAIDRLDGLVRDLLQFADRKPGQVAEVDLAHEVQATLKLLQEDLRREQITVAADLIGEPAPIVMDATRLRQALLNLLTLAQHRAGRQGTIMVRVARREGVVEVVVADSGPPLSEEQRAHLFEPFQAPAETGSGLGLALVQAFVEEAGGQASWEGGATAAGQCRLSFPLAGSGQKGAKP